MDDQVLKENWKQLKETVRARWQRLSEDDLSLIDGDAEYLAKTLRQRYDWSAERAAREVRLFLAQLQAIEVEHPERLADVARELLAPGARKVREGLEQLSAAVRALGRESMSRVREKATEGADRVADSAHETGERVRETAADAADEASALLERVEHFVRERPFTSIGIAFLAGYLLLGRR